MLTGTTDDENTDHPIFDPSHMLIRRSRTCVQHHEFNPMAAIQSRNRETLEDVMKTAAAMDQGEATTTCAITPIKKSADKPLTLDLFDYFEGCTRAWGLFEDRLGNVRRQFRVNISGRVEQGLLVLDENFLYQDGERSARTWRIRREGEHEYLGQADDLIGSARGRVSGNAVDWRYRMRLAVGKRTWQFDFDDRMYLQPDGILLNRSKVRKFGFEVGSVTLAFARA